VADLLPARRVQHPEVASVPARRVGVAHRDRGRARAGRRQLDAERLHRKSIPGSTWMPRAGSPAPAEAGLASGLTELRRGEGGLRYHFTRYASGSKELL